MDAFDLDLSAPVEQSGFSSGLGGPNQGGHQAPNWYIQYGMDIGATDGTPVYAAFDAHSSPLGLEYFDESNGDKLRGSFLVGLHGSTKKNLNRGYRVVQLAGSAHNGNAVPEDFINGFLQGGKVYGRPVDILAFGPDAFLLTDDYAGVVYYVAKK